MRKVRGLVVVGGVVAVAGLYSGYALGASSLGPSNDHRDWSNEKGEIQYGRIPDRMPVYGPKGETLGYMDSWVIFQDPSEPAEIAKAESDGPFDVYSSEDSDTVVGRYFRGGGFVDEETYARSDGEPPPSSPPTTIGERAER